MTNQHKESIEIPDDVDPVEFLRKLLEISPEDAEAAREQAAKDAAGDADDRS